MDDLEKDDYFQCCPEEDCDFIARGEGAKKKVRQHFSRVHKSKPIPNDLLLHSENSMECPFDGCAVKMCGQNKIANLRTHYETVHAGHELPEVLRRIRPQKSTADVDPLERLWKGCVPVPEAKLKKIPVLSRKVRLSQEEDDDDDANNFDIETAILVRKPRRGVLGIGALVTKSASDKENGVKSSSSSSSEVSFENDEHDSDSSDNSVLVEFAKGGLPQAQWKQDLKSDTSEDEDFDDLELKQAAPFQAASKVRETFFIEVTDDEIADSGASIVYSGSDADLAPYESELEFFDSLFKDKTPKKRKKQNTKAQKSIKKKKQKLTEIQDETIPETPVVQTTTVIYLPDSPKETPKHDKSCYLSESSNSDDDLFEKKPLIQLKRRKLKRPNLKNFDGSFGDDSKHEADGLVQTKIGNFFSPAKTPGPEQTKRLSSRFTSPTKGDTPETSTKTLDVEFTKSQDKLHQKSPAASTEVKAKSNLLPAYTKSNTASSTTKIVGEISLLSDNEENIHAITDGNEIIVLSD